VLIQPHAFSLSLDVVRVGVIQGSQFAGAVGVGVVWFVQNGGDVLALGQVAWLESGRHLDWVEVGAQVVATQLADVVVVLHVPDLRQLYLVPAVLVLELRQVVL
jgi:hypothetical protein